MRPLLPLIVACALATACRCGPDTPTAVTLRVKNTGRSPLWVDVTDGRLGVEIQRRVGSEWYGFAEQPPCPCLACDQVCRGCACAPAQHRVMKLGAGSTTERQWGGLVQIQSDGQCELFVRPQCVSPEIPSTDEVFRASFCYALSVPASIRADAGESTAGQLPDAGMNCATREFQISDGVVEVTPLQGAACADHAECQSAEELCLDGQCTTACPTNDFPQPGAGWQLTVEEPDDQGFFALAQTADRKTWTGSGTVSSVRYDNGVMTLRLGRPNPAGGNPLTGAVYVTLPGTHAVAFDLNEPVSVTVVDRSVKGNYGQRAIVLRDGGGRILLVADAAQRERVLADGEVAPFAVNVDGAIAGCAPTDCGKQLQSKTVFTAGGQPVDVAPGAAERLVVSGQAYLLLNAANVRYASTPCPLKKFTPYAILNTRQSTP